MKSTKPLIGIVPDYRPGSKECYSIRPYYALRCNYVEMIAKSGGIPIIISYEHNLINDYLSFLDGLIIVGGAFDINPNRYKESEIHSTVKLNITREDFEFKIADAALKTNMPFFGICNGMQLLNVLQQGNIIQNILDDNKFMDHEQVHNPKFNDYSRAYHQVNIEQGSKLAEIIKQDSIITNSSHHQAVKKIGNQLKVSARACDGIIEAIEKTDHPFCLGVQWHPEFNSNNSDQQIFNAFIKEARKYQQIKND
jgi:putative glutamine amidotransferase